MRAASSLHDVYAESKDHVRRSGMTSAEAEACYGAYVKYLSHFADLRGKSVVDVGCGNGWSSFLLSQHGAVVTGVDLHTGAFEPATTPSLYYQRGSATALPLADSSVDVVSTHECLEHVDDPRRALSEFDRVLKPGGVVCIVGPNLLSGLQSLRGLLIYAWKTRPLYHIFWRYRGMARHPHGNTIWEILFKFLVHSLWILQLVSFRKPLFKMREPDLKPPFHADNDACYYLNPLDMEYYFKSLGYEIINSSGKDRPSFLKMISSGTWFCARKPKHSVV